MVKVNLKDVTFVIPIRIDSIIRLENCIATINFILKELDTNIIVIESSPYNNSILKSLLKKDQVEYYFIEDFDPIFYRTKYLNIATNEVITPYIGIWDADVVLNTNQIFDSIQKLRCGECDIAYPYDGLFLDTSDIIRIFFLKNRLQISYLERHKSKMNNMYQGIMFGGAFFVNTEKYNQSGKENLSFYGWGPEDAERYWRWRILGYSIYRSVGPLFHLSHPRDMNGMFRSKIQSEDLLDKLERVMESTSHELKANI